MREAQSAFGDPRMYLEQAVIRPRHIEVQILADVTGEVIHLYERDCSVQRRHQKVIEIAPAQNLDRGVARRDLRRSRAVRAPHRLRQRRHGRVPARVEDGRFVFIEMNPRIQVEHTVTEEITDVDLVSSQIRIAAGETLADLGLTQQSVRVRGAALQCRITTEDPSNGFRPDTGTLTTYRTPGGAGIRLDGGTVFTGSDIGAHFDSMLVKLTCRGHDFDTAVRRAARALSEFRIRGVSTNIGFLEAVLTDPDFLAGRITTSFIDERPGLLEHRMPADRATKLLTYLAGVTVNRPYGEPRTPIVAPDQAARPGPRPGRAASSGIARRAAYGSVPRASRRRSGTGRASPSPTPRSATRTSRCWPRVYGPATSSTSPRTSRACCPACGRPRPGAVPRSTSRCGSSRRTPGPGSRTCTS